MNNQVEFHLRAADNDDIIKPLSDFFSPIASTKINKPDFVVKSVEPIVIILTILSTMGVAPWASQRYLLDPIADKADDWWEGVSFLWKKSQRVRNIEVKVNFQFPTDIFQVNIGETSDIKSIKFVWANVNKACELYAQARSNGIQIDQLRFIPDGTQDMLIIAYVNNRPVYLVDSNTRTLKEIKNAKARDISKEIWVVNSLIQQYNYMKLIETSPDQLRQLEKEIQAKKNNIRK